MGKKSRENMTGMSLDVRIKNSERKRLELEEKIRELKKKASDDLMQYIKENIPKKEDKK